MSITPELAALALTILTIMGMIWGASKKFTTLEDKIKTMESDLLKSDNDRKKNEEILGLQINHVDQRVQRVETSIATIDAKLDAVKEGVNDLKKLIVDHKSRAN